MMKKVFLSSLIVLVLCTGVAIAAMEHRMNQGLCDDGVTLWWSVTTYTDGIATSISGTGCDGVHYYHPLGNRVIMSSDPTGGIHTHTGTGSNGMPWFSRLKYDSQNRVDWMGGKDPNGVFYVIEIAYEGFEGDLE